MGLRQMFPVQTKRMRLCVATVKGGNFTGCESARNTERPVCGGSGSRAGRFGWKLAHAISNAEVQRRIRSFAEEGYCCSDRRCVSFCPSAILSIRLCASSVENDRTDRAGIEHGEERYEGEKFHPEPFHFPASEWRARRSSSFK